MKYKLLAILLLFTELITARAGHFHSRSHSSIHFQNILYLLIASIIFVFIFKRVIIKKDKNNSNFLKKLATKDSNWEPNYIKEMAKNTYLTTQEAWQKNEWSIAKKYLTDELYNKYKNIATKMKKENKKNIISDISIEEIKIIKVDIEKNEISIYIAGSMIDYIINEKTEIIEEGRAEVENYFKDKMVFVQQNNKWLLKDIIKYTG